MKKQFLIFFIFQSLFYVSFAQINDIETFLADQRDINYVQINDEQGYKAAYELRIKQPIDHSDHSKGYFNQRVFLSHKGFEQAMVFVTEGYGAFQNGIGELTKLLNANQLRVEHRFFGVSSPDPVDYEYLNLTQATADLHRIRQLFAEAYVQKWLSTGISKGGATSIFYRYFYPDDVDVSVPYVAPMNKTLEENRIYEFLDTIGSDSCRKKIRDFQKLMLEKKRQILPLVKFYSLGAKAKYGLLTLGQAFEYAVMEYPFSFWQWGYNCDEIPNSQSSTDALLSHLLAVSNPTFFSDESIEYYGPHYYQSATEMGYYGYKTFEFKGLLTEIPTDYNPQATFIPFEMNKEFDGLLLDQVNKWLETDANNMLYIYGANDTWSASAVPLNKKVNSKWFMMPGKHHGNARIKNMSESEKERFISTLEKWLDIDISRD